MKKVFIAALMNCIGFISLQAQVINSKDLSQTTTENLCDFVNPFIGASTNIEDAGAYHGLGKTIPGATTPFGLVQVSPNTITGGDNGSGYSYEHESMEGFAFTQMSGIGWYGDLGNFLVMPTTGTLKTNAGKLDNPDKGYRSRYDKKQEKASAGYYSVFLTDYQIQVEATAAPHSGMLKFTFPKNKESRIQIDLARRVGGTSSWQEIKKIDDHTLAGKMVCTPEGGGWGNGDGGGDYTVYFYAQCSKPILKYGVWNVPIQENEARKRENIESIEFQQRVANAQIIRNTSSYAGKHIGFFSEFATYEKEEVFLKVGISFVSEEGAKKNLLAEIKNWDFNQVLQKNRSLWNKALSKITIQTQDEETKTIFYTALYRTMLDPRLFSDIDGKYIGGDKQIHETNKFHKRTIFSGWDVFRSQMPLQTIINPEVVNDLLNSLITLGEESGKEYFERWEFLNAYSGCMVGNPAISVLADAYNKGIRSYDMTKAWKLALNTSHRFGNETYGYIPGSISETLEYAYNEWCMATLAHSLEDWKAEQKYLNLAQSYRRIYDPEKQSFRPKDKEGKYLPWPEQGRLEEGYGCVESNPLQQNWFVPQDVAGLTELFGGREAIIMELDSMFEKTPSHFLWNPYYNHANEPVHHVPYLYNHLQEPWKTQYWTRFICRNAYKNDVKGLVGNEDVGQMSAWYVLSSMGIHPLCPGETRMELTSPVFDQVKIKVGDNNYFTISVHNQSSDHVYIQSALLNGKPYNQCHIDYKEIMQGGTLELFMSDTPNPKWGVLFK